jgi:hypothetical protein
MARFTTRVELLNDASREDYDTLHFEMERRNFTRTITDDTTGIVYQLPPAEYNRDGDYTRQQTINAAEAAAQATGNPYRIIVTESNGRTWTNLEIVN